MDISIKNVSYELLDKTHLTTDILLIFEDKGINKDLYNFIKDYLKDFNLNIDSEYSFTLDYNCDFSKDILFIEIVLSIPDLHKPLDVDLEQIINHLSYNFTKFYEREIQLFKNNGRISKIERN